jgi:hypothetical protein
VGEEVKPHARIGARLPQFPRFFFLAHDERSQRGARKKSQIKHKYGDDEIPIPGHSISFVTAFVAATVMPKMVTMINIPEA